MVEPAFPVSPAVPMAEPAASPPFLIAAEDVCLRYGARWVLDHVSLEVRAGDFVTLVGPNGAGKTTLLKVMLGLVPTTHGAIRRAPGLRVGYLPQRVPWNETLPMPVSRFLALGTDATRAECAAVLEETGLRDVQHSMLQELSGGEMQRVLLARAILRRPQLLVLDEPAQNLDLGGQVEFYAVLDRIVREQNLAILMVSHDLHLVMARTKRVVCLYHHICCEGAPAAVAEDPAFLDAVGRDMRDLVALYTHRHDHTHAGAEGCAHHAHA